MFENYTNIARKVIFFARYEATQLCATAIEPEHILLGLLREKGVSSIVLTKTSFLSLEQVRKEIELSSKGAKEVTTNLELSLSPTSKNVLRKAQEESVLLQNNLVATIHILLALATVENTTANQILSSNGLTSDFLYNKIKTLNLNDLIESEIDKPTLFKAIDNLSSFISLLRQKYSKAFNSK